MQAKRAESGGTRATPAYVVPFAVFVGMLAVRRLVPVPPEVFAAVRFVLVAAALAVFSRGVIRWRLVLPAGSVLLGVAVFFIWIGPDMLWPGYRDSWLFHNAVTGQVASAWPATLKHNAWFLTLRVVESAVLVPVLEELFWRGWLMRWIIRADFEKVPLGQYAPLSFWLVALLFASEHGPYWEVGLIAGVAYNWWMVRTRSLVDCMVAHGVTNAVLAAYVIFFDKWSYWL
jgi:CAAX prenyl protease-like protein